MDETIQSVMQTTSDGDNTRVKSKTTAPLAQPENTTIQGSDEDLSKTREEQKAPRRRGYEAEPKTQGKKAKSVKSKTTTPVNTPLENDEGRKKREHEAFLKKREARKQKNHSLLGRDDNANDPSPESRTSKQRKNANKGWCRRNPWKGCFITVFVIISILTAIAYGVGKILCDTGIIDGSEEICKTFSAIGYGYSISPLKGPDVYTVFAEDLCSSNPCKNGGTCERVGLSAYTRCRCAARFSGPSCETEQERQPCEGEPCQNDAYCKVDENENEICICNPGFIGALCEEEIPEMVYTPASPDPCGASNSCYNGGTCQPDGDGGYVCDCPTGTSGTWCQNNGETTDQDQGNVSKKTKKTTSSSGIWILVALAVVVGIVVVFFVAAAKRKDGKGKKKPKRLEAAFNP